MTADPRRVTDGLGLRLYDDALSTIQTLELAERAEARGYDTIWMPESAGREAFSQLAVYAVRTRRLRLGTGIVNVYTRTPTLLAMSVATLDQLSAGRAVLGLGTGHKEDLERGHGVTFEQPFQRLREYVSLLRAILRGDDPPSSRLCPVTRFRLAFSPERRALPIYLAALGPRMCELAGEIADGVLLNWATPGYVEEAVAHVRTGAERAGRSVGEIHIACYIRTAVTSGPQSPEFTLALELTRYVAVDVYRRMLEASGFAEDVLAVVHALPQGMEAAARKVSARLLEAVAMVGSDPARQARLERYRRAGVTQPVIAPVAVGPDALASWTRAIDAFAPMPTAGPKA